MDESSGDRPTTNSLVSPPGSDHLWLGLTELLRVHLLRRREVASPGRLIRLLHRLLRTILRGLGLLLGLVRPLLRLLRLLKRLLHLLLR